MNFPVLQRRQLRREAIALLHRVLATGVPEPQAIARIAAGIAQKPGLRRGEFDASVVIDTVAMRDTWLAFPRVIREGIGVEVAPTLPWTTECPCCDRALQVYRERLVCTCSWSCEKPDDEIAAAIVRAARPGVDRELRAHNIEKRLDITGQTAPVCWTPTGLALARDDALPPPFPQLAEMGVTSIQLVNGQVDQIALSTRAFAEHGDILLDLAPIRSIVLRGELELILGMGALHRIQGLSLEIDRDPEPLLDEGLHLGHLAFTRHEISAAFLIRMASATIELDCFHTKHESLEVELSNDPHAGPYYTWSEQGSELERIAHAKQRPWLNALLARARQT